jgi:hypothetical protein
MQRMLIIYFMLISCEINFEINASLLMPGKETIPMGEPVAAVFAKRPQVTLPNYQTTDYRDF